MGMAERRLHSWRDRGLLSLAGLPARESLHERSQAGGLGGGGRRVLPRGPPSPLIGTAGQEKPSSVLLSLGYSPGPEAGCWLAFSRYAPVGPTTHPATGSEGMPGLRAAKATMELRETHGSRGD